MYYGAYDYINEQCTFVKTDAQSGAKIWQTILSDSDLYIHKISLQNGNLIILSYPDYILSEDSGQIKVIGEYGSVLDPEGFIWEQQGDYWRRVFRKYDFNGNLIAEYHIGSCYPSIRFISRDYLYVEEENSLIKLPKSDLEKVCVK